MIELGIRIDARRHQAPGINGDDHRVTPLGLKVAYDQPPTARASPPIDMARAVAVNIFAQRFEFAALAPCWLWAHSQFFEQRAMRQRGASLGRGSMRQNCNRAAAGDCDGAQTQKSEAGAPGYQSGAELARSGPQRHDFARQFAVLTTFQFNSLDDQIAAGINREFVENRYDGCGGARPRYAISNAGGP